MKDEKWKFTAEDFAPHGLCEFVRTTWVIERANELIRKWIEASPVVNIRSGYMAAMHGMTPLKVERESTARLICIEPIARDTAESLLRDMIKYVDGGNGLTLEMHGYLDRARKLLESK